MKFWALEEGVVRLAPCGGGASSGELREELKGELPQKGGGRVGLMERAKSAPEGSEIDDQVSNSGDDDDYDWEEGETGVNASSGENAKDLGKREWNGEVSLSMNGDEDEELEGSSAAGKNGTLKRKAPAQRRANAQDKEFAEMVHKAHLLCLLARGRIVDAACNDPLLQASMLSLIPPSVCLPVDAAVPTRNVLGDVVSWFMRSFRIVSPGEGPSSSTSNPGFSKEEFSAGLRRSIERQAGSAEEVAALSVVLLRSLGFMTRYVTVLDVASLKPDAESLEASENLGSSSYEQRPFFSPHVDLETTRVASLAQILAHSVPRTVVPQTVPRTVVPVVPKTMNGTHKNLSLGGERGSPSSVQDPKPEPRSRGRPKGAGGRGQVKNGRSKLAPEPAEVEVAGQKRSGDDEFERELAMAIAATAAVAEAEGKRGPKTEPPGVNVTPKQQQQQQPPASDAKRLKRIKGLGQSGNASLKEKLGFTSKQEVGGGSNGAVWSRKLGPVMHWAEVYITGDATSGRWVHVDGARGIVDGADKIEGAAAACRLPLRYVVAFVGSGAKDVTRRYVTLWSTVDRLRVDQDWWDSTLNLLKQLEAAAIAGPPPPPPTFLPSTSSQADATAPEGANGSNASKQPDRPNIHDDDRSALEDMEMETKTFTEPLPTNQQAFKSHHLYVIEKWLTKYQTLHPRGPVLGYCAGHPVYPRACVQVLHTPDSWLREGFKVKVGEAPAKVVKASRFVAKKEVESAVLELEENEEKDGKEEKTTALYGKWQTHPWQPPRAVDGKVPRNERGQVDVWSEKCIPPGTVHLRFPGLVPVAQKLGVDFAPAMVGFEVRRGRTFPVYDGLVICEEFKDLIMDAYMAHEEARCSALWKKREENAAKRWRHLIYSMATRQRLQAAYEDNKAVAAAKPKQREALSSPKALPKAEPLRSVADGAHPSDGQATLEKKKGAQKQGQGLQPQHVHQFPEENQSYDEDTGIRTKLCACGFSYFVEEM